MIPRGEQKRGPCGPRSFYYLFQHGSHLLLDGLRIFYRPLDDLIHRRDVADQTQRIIHLRDGRMEREERKDKD